MKTRIWWLDIADLRGAKDKFEAARAKQFPDWDIVHFNEASYDHEEATGELLTLLLTPPAFSPGKVVSCQDIPLRKAPEKCQAKLTSILPDIPDGVLLLIMARLDRTCSLYKTISKMKESALIEEEVRLDKNNAAGWVRERASKMGLTIDPVACNALADQAELNPGRIHNELRKLKAFSPDGHVSARMVGTVAFGFGAVDIFSLGKALLARNGEAAHERLQRMLDHNQDPEAICAILQDWLLRLCLAEGCGRDAARAKAASVGLMKWNKKKDGPKKSEDVEGDPSWGEFSRIEGESVPMFANPMSLEYACNDLRKNGTMAGWSYYARRRLAALNLRMRKEGKDADPGKMLHGFLAEMMEIQGEAND